MLLLQFVSGIIVALEEAQDGDVTQGVGGGVKMVGDKKVLSFVVYRVQMLYKMVLKSTFGLTDGSVVCYYYKFTSVKVLVKLSHTKDNRQTCLLYLGPFELCISQSPGSKKDIIKLKRVQKKLTRMLLGMDGLRKEIKDQARNCRTISSASVRKLQLMINEDKIKNHQVNV
eukprot:g39911.t1